MKKFIDLIDENDKSIHRFYDLEQLKRFLSAILHRNLTSCSLQEVKNSLYGTSSIRLVPDYRIEHFIQEELHELNKTVDLSLLHKKCARGVRIYEKAASKIRFDYRKLIDFYHWHIS